MNYRPVGSNVEFRKFVPQYINERFPEIDRLRVGIGNSGTGKKPIMIYAHGIPATGVGPYKILFSHPAISETQEGAIAEARNLRNSEERVIGMLLEQFFGIEAPAFK